MSGFLHNGDKYTEIQKPEEKWGREDGGSRGTGDSLLVSSEKNDGAGYVLTLQIYKHCAGIMVFQTPIVAERVTKERIWGLEKAPVRLLPPSPSPPPHPRMK